MKFSKHLVLTAAALCVAGVVGVSYSQSSSDMSTGTTTTNPSGDPNASTYSNTTPNTPSTGMTRKGGERVARVDRN